MRAGASPHYERRASNSFPLNHRHLWWVSVLHDWPRPCRGIFCKKKPRRSGALVEAGLSCERQTVEQVQVSPQKSDVSTFNFTHVASPTIAQIRMIHIIAPTIAVSKSHKMSTCPLSSTVRGQVWPCS
jgi:hypothetical protein